MHGLIFVTWEKFLAEQFGSKLLAEYRTALGETAASGPLANRIYSDEMLLIGLGVASQLAGVSADTLLRGYGRYFILNGLTSHLCSYLLSQVHHGSDLLLTMSTAHAQLQRSDAAVTPPLFQYKVNATNHNALTLFYESPRQLCVALAGAIQGAAERYNEKVEIVERTCMKRGDAFCSFAVQFFPPQEQGKEVNVRLADHSQEKRALADLILTLLPEKDGITMAQLQARLKEHLVSDQYVRLHKVWEGLQMLEHVGLASSTTNQPGDTFRYRRYWRVSKIAQKRE